MADTTTHGNCWLLPGAVNGIAYLCGANPIFEPWTVFMFTFGAAIPDITELPIWYEFKRRFGKLDLRYNGRMTDMLEDIEEEHPSLLWLYKWVHSFAGVMLVSTILYLFIPMNLVLPYALGHTLHVVIDMFCHRKSQPLWPVLGLQLQLTIDNWWEWNFYHKHYWQIIGFGGVLNIVGLLWILPQTVF